MEIAKIGGLIVKENDGYADALCVKDNNGMQAVFDVCFDRKFDIQMKKKTWLQKGHLDVSYSISL